jgi:hypothetical protein
VPPHPPRPVSRTDAELRALRAEIAALRRLTADTRLQAQLVHLRLIRGGPLRHGWLKLVIKDLETNPRTQYKVHFWGAVWWLVNLPLVVCLFFFAPGLWLKLGIFITLVYSIYANFATDYGGMSAAMASFGLPRLPDIPAEPPLADDSVQIGTDLDGDSQLWTGHSAARTR